MAGDPRVGYITQRAQQLGLDPEAVLAIASHEGLSGGIGDGGHAFGPFQMNNAGGVLTGKFQGMSPQQINAWAWSHEGIDHALGGIAQAARGLKGRAAIEAIATKYERPANPQAEIADAWAHYGKMGAGGRVTAPNVTAGLGGGNPAPAVDSTGGLTRQRVAQLVFGAGNKVDFNSNQVNVPNLMALAQARTLANGSAAPSAPGAGGSVPAGAPMAKGRYVLPANGKLIGEPYQGTHGKSFNQRGGSDNWESENAVDIAVPVGTPLRATAAGVIGSQFGSLGSSSSRMQGLRLHLKTGDNEFYYAHLSKYAPGIGPGVRVQKGQIIGYSGSANGVAHLHLGVQSGNPASMFGG